MLLSVEAAALVRKLIVALVHSSLYPSGPAL